MMGFSRVFQAKASTSARPAHLKQTSYAGPRVFHLRVERVVLQHPHPVSEGIHHLLWQRGRPRKTRVLPGCIQRRALDCRSITTRSMPMSAGA